MKMISGVFRLYAGTGILKNYHMKKINWGLTTALLQELVLNKNYSLKLKAGGIIGWSVINMIKIFCPTSQSDCQESFEKPMKII